VERDRAARGTISENLRRTGFSERGEVVAGDVGARWRGWRGRVGASI
jgi:hypothetical protein